MNRLSPLEALEAEREAIEQAGLERAGQWAAQKALNTVERPVTTSQPRFKEVDWVEEARCNGVDANQVVPELIPDEIRTTKGNVERIKKPAAEIKQLCADCPVRIPCLRYAVEYRIDRGIYGGMDELERVGFIRRNGGKIKTLALLNKAS